MSRKDDNIGCVWTQKACTRPLSKRALFGATRLLPGKKLDIRLDRLTDKYGSPSIDDIEKFSRYGALRTLL